MKFNKYTILVIFFICFVSGCSSIKDTLSGVKKNNSDEFLVKKKDPLVMPPDFNDLPKPQTQNIEENNENESIDFSKVLGAKKSKKEKPKTDKGSLEKSISNILNNK